MNDKTLAWEDAVEWLKAQPEQQDLIRACYYDDPLINAAQRFSESEEWQEVHKILANWMPGNVLDLGAGNGISSYAFAKEGCKVTALEPDPSLKVGAGAIRVLSKEINNSITVVQALGEALPFNDGVFDIVHCRQVLHHADNLEQLCGEVSRVLRVGGVLIATREHVISKSSDLDDFLRSHPLHSLYGGENAFLLKQYQHAISKAGLKMKETYGPYESVINYFPISQSQLSDMIVKKLEKYIKIPSWIVKQKLLSKILLYGINKKDRTPGRLYSFVAVKN
jgi:ubiquinone/menaquinone biosynthesis C-methylase UbiE